MFGDQAVEADEELGGELLLDNDSGVGARRGSLSAEIARAQSGAPREAARSERNNRQATSDDFDPHSSIHRDATTLEDAQLNLDDELDTDVEGNPLKRGTQPPNQQPPAAVDPSKPAGTEAPFDLFTFAKGEGVDLSAKYKSPAEAAKGLLHAHRLVGQRNEAAQQWEELISNPQKQREIYQALHEHFGPIPAPAGTTSPSSAATAAPSASPATAAPASTVTSRPKPPTLPNGWKYHFDENGQAKPNADPNVVAQVEAVRADRRLQQEDPAAYYEKWFKADAEEAALRAFEAKQTELEKKRAEEAAKAQREQQTAQQFEHVKSSTLNRLEQEGWFKWLYEPGYSIGNGQVNGTLTPAGHDFNRFLAEAAAAHENGLPLYPHPYQRAMYARNKLIEQSQANGTAPTNGHAAPQVDPRLAREPGGNVGGAPRMLDHRDTSDLRTMLRANLRAAGELN